MRRNIFVKSPDKQHGALLLVMRKTTTTMTLLARQQFVAGRRIVVKRQTATWLFRNRFVLFQPLDCENRGDDKDRIRPCALHSFLPSLCKTITISVCVVCESFLF